MSNIKFYRFKFKLVSPLSIGSGDDKNTDSDIILDSRNKPVIPATAFAGVIRHYICGDDNKKKNTFFGYINRNDSADSKVKFYDAILCEDAVISIRDNVALENKVGKDGAKFDREIAETGAEFVSMMEISDANETEIAKILDALSAMNRGELRIGSKTSRGFGQIEIIDIRKAEFNLPEGREDYVKFKPFDYENNDYYQEINLESIESKFVKIHLELQQKGAISIRSYTVKDKDEIHSADYVGLSLKKGVPVIPGSSWAGAFRERFEAFSDKLAGKNMFGYVDETEKDQKKSEIYFSESQIEDSVEKIITRNSIDRFSGGTKDGALYTEKTFYNGKCNLDILVKKEQSEYLRTLSAVICDLDRGYLAVGGLTSVGRGLFKVEKMTINGNDKTEAMKKGSISEMVEGVLE